MSDPKVSTPLFVRNPAAPRRWFAPPPELAQLDADVERVPHLRADRAELLRRLSIMEAMVDDVVGGAVEQRAQLRRLELERERLARKVDDLVDDIVQSRLDLDLARSARDEAERVRTALELELADTERRADSWEDKAWWARFEAEQTDCFEPPVWVTAHVLLHAIALLRAADVDDVDADARAVADWLDDVRALR